MIDLLTDAQEQDDRFDPATFVFGTVYFARAHASGWDFVLSPPLLTALTT